MGATGKKKKKVIRAEWPRVYWTPKDGRLVLCVDSRKTGFAHGGRQFWHSEAEALACAEQIARTLANEGSAGFAELTPAERRDAALALAHLDGAGTLMDAAILFVRERERRERMAHIPTVNEAIDAYLNAKRVEEQSGQIVRVTYSELVAKMHIVRRAFGQLKVTEIDEAAVSDFIRKLPHAARGRAAVRTKLSQFLNYCRREGKWITVNPAEGVKVRVKNDKDVEILSVQQTRQLLNAALTCEHPASVIPYLTVQLFAGLRPTEAAKLQWERIHFETGQIEVLGKTSKTRESRFVEIAPLLAEWLLVFRLSKGPIIGDRFAHTLRSVRAAADLLPWPKDVLRHCFGSYWLAVHKDRAHLAELMGNSLQVIKQHYRRAIQQSVAEEFWKLAPSPGPEPGKVIPVPATVWSKEPELTTDHEDSHITGMKEQPTPEEFPTLRFQFAKTMPAIPHWHVVRSPENETDYVRLFHRIGEAGSFEEWKDGRRYQYWYHDGFKYWRMSDKLTESQVINRAKA